MGLDLAGGFLRQKGLQLALSQMKTCKSERESCVYYEKVARASSPGRILVRGEKSDGTLPHESPVICLVVGGGPRWLCPLPVQGFGRKGRIRASFLN